jgi:hypothetical protein
MMIRSLKRSKLLLERRGFTVLYNVFDPQHPLPPLTSIDRTIAGFLKTKNKTYLRQETVHFDPAIGGENTMTDTAW